MNRRSFIKILHWLCVGLILWFWLVEPEDIERLGPAALATHAGMGIILGLLVAGWLAMYLHKGLSGRPGPKLPGWARTTHPLMHRALYWGLPAMVFSGALTGFAAPFVIRAFGLLAINPGFGGRGIHDLLEEVHEFAFNALIILIVAHVAFHLWRHYRLQDNALRIMVPKILHKYI